MEKISSTDEFATKGELHDLRKEINEDMKMYMGTLYEKFSGDVKLLSEQISSIDRKVDSLDAKVEKMSHTVNATFDMVGKNTTQIAELEDKQTHFDQRLSHLEATA